MTLKRASAGAGKLSANRRISQDKLKKERKDALDKKNKYRGKLVLLGAGHGALINDIYQTAGKRAYYFLGKLMNVKALGVEYCEANCDEKYYEGVGNRDIRAIVAQKCQKEGIEYAFINTGPDDLALHKRTNRVNELCEQYGVDNCLGFSLHSDGVDFKQRTARGASAFTSIGQTDSDAVATKWYEIAKKRLPNEEFRTDNTDSDPDKEKNLAMTRDTDCRFVLIENFFMTNYKDYSNHLKTDEGREILADIIFETIKACI